MKVSTPASAEEALEMLAADPWDTRVIAGGTALVTMMRQRLVAPEHLVSLHRVQGLSNVVLRDGMLRIGALTPQRALEVHPLVRELYPIIPQALTLASNVRVRNVATLGGALVHADPNQDSTTVLLALGASVVLRSKDAERTVPLDAFFVDYYETCIESGELLVEVLLPAPPESSRAAFRKFLPRSQEDYGVVNVAVQMEQQGGSCTQVRIALGCVADTPLRATAAEAHLTGANLTTELLADAAETVRTAVDPVTDSRGSADWKRAMAVVWVRRTLEALLD